MKCYLTVRNIKYQKVHRNIFFYFNDVYHLTPPSSGDIKPQGFFASTSFFSYSSGTFFCPERPPGTKVSCNLCIPGQGWKNEQSGPEYKVGPRIKSWANLDSINKIAFDCQSGLFFKYKLCIWLIIVLISCTRVNQTYVLHIPVYSLVYLKKEK